MIALPIRSSIDALRERRSILASAAVHTALLVGLVLHEPPPVAEALTEITILDFPETTAPSLPMFSPVEEAHEEAPASEPAPEEPPPVTPRRVVTKEVPAEPEHFARESSEAAVAPRPQSLEKLDDDVRRRLMAGSVPTRSTTSSAMGVADVAPTDSQPRAMGASTAPTRGPVALSRGAPVSGDRRVTLERGAPGPESSSARAQLQRVAVPEPEGQSTAGADSTLTLLLAGASLMGPIVDRPLLDNPAPVYPEWAKRSAVEGSVKLTFVVQPNGSARSNVLVERTSGFPDFDGNAVSALRAWRFEPLPPGSSGDQWGSVTFNYRLTN